jgi:predicted ATPase
MRITKLSLTNFKAFKETQEIEFAPVTLLFGPNSAGKSSVLLALFYVQQILDKRQVNPQRIESLGNKLIGGFKDLVNGRDLKKSIVIKIEYDKKEAIGSSYTRTQDFMSELEERPELPIMMDSPSRESNTAAVEFEISWSESLKTAFIRKYTVWLNGSEVGSLTSDTGLKNPFITYLDFFHPLLEPSNNDEWIKEFCGSTATTVHSEYRSELQELIDENGEWMEESFSEKGVRSQFHYLIEEQFPIGVNADAGALPILGKELVTTLSLETDAAVNILNETLTEVFVSPLDNLLKLLNDSICIGPLRAVPDATYTPNPYPKQADWFNGTAAWDMLAKNDYELLSSVNSWISSETKLALGYEIALKADITYSVNETISSGASFNDIHQRLVDEGGKASKNEFANFDNTHWSWSHALWDIAQKMSVMPSEIGVGVSQLLPLVVAALSTRKGIVSCEQPELHVHPRVQVAIGDLFTQVEGEANFLIETHSEHLILRLLKRVRQTTDNELPEGIKPVTKDSISIVYLEPSDAGVTTKKIEIDEDGEFTSRWPQGFFSERRDEVM